MPFPSRCEIFRSLGSWGPKAAKACTARRCMKSFTTFHHLASSVPSTRSCWPLYKQDSLQKHDKVAKTVEKHSSNLLRLLSSHTRVKRKVDATNLPVADGSRKDSGGVSKPATVFPTGIQLEMPGSQEAFKVDDGQERRRCPLCGNLFVVPSGEYDDHFHAELVALADQDLETWDTDNRSNSDNLGASNALEDAPRVYVLGGLPSHAVPKDPKKFRPSAIKLQKIKRSPSVPAANHYADGGGLLGGEELGIDGHNTAGLKWEGMGSSYNL